MELSRKGRENMSEAIHAVTPDSFPFQAYQPLQQSAGEDEKGNTNPAAQNRSSGCPASLDAERK